MLLQTVERDFDKIQNFQYLGFIFFERQYDRRQEENFERLLIFVLLHFERIVFEIVKKNYFKIMQKVIFYQNSTRPYNYTH
jgi:hypothetical protein